MTRKPYLTDVSDDEWGFVAPYLTLMTEDAPQREHSLREVFNGLRWMAKRAQASTKDAQQQLEQFRHEIALWYEQSTDQISGVYQRHVKAFTVLVSTILAVLINADMLYMLRRISENTAIRTVIIQNAV